MQQNFEVAFLYLELYIYIYIERTKASRIMYFNVFVFCLIVFYYFFLLNVLRCSCPWPCSWPFPFALLVFYFSTHERHFLVVSKVGHKPKIKIAISNFHGLHCWCLYWSILRHNLWAVANLSFRLQQQLGSWGTHWLTLHMTQKGDRERVMPRT